MFKYCKHIDRVCDFSVDSVYCGIGKGESRIEDVKECDGKHPKFKRNLRNMDEVKNGKELSNL